MKSFSKIGRVVLKHLFTKKQIFSITSFERSGGIKTMERKINLPLDPICLEKEFRARVVNLPDRARHYKIFVWGVEIGLIEIKLIPLEMEGKLIDLVCQAVQGTVPSHIVIAEKKHWDYDFEQFVQEEINIYSCTNEQKILIENIILAK